jgi:hypothetical protein
MSTMCRRSDVIFRSVLLMLVLVSLLLVACGGKPSTPKAGKQPEGKTEKATPTQKPQAKATEVKDTPTPSEGGEQTELGNLLDNLAKLAPLHLTSSFTYKKGDQPESTSSFEADLDAKGNQHIYLHDQNNQKTELYVVDLKLYIRDEDGTVLALGDLPQGGAFAFLAVYGGAYLLALNNPENARRVGSETVNGFATDKYEVKVNLMAAGVAGVAAKVEGAEWDYKGYAWIESRAKALVRSQVDWKGRGSSQEAMESYHAEFEAKKGTVTEITAPTNATAIVPPTAKAGAEPEVTETSEPEPTLEPEPTEEPQPTEEPEPTEEPAEESEG